MSTKKCAKCEKIVYPTELLNCLDKYWHKGCFKCQSCNMTLNMKNYKGYDKLPYCNAHYPTTKHTAVAETPELRRIAANTKIQSNVEYHKDFEQTKDQIHQVADTLEMKRVKDNTKNISLVEYHKDFEQSKDHIHQTADTLEMKRVKDNTKNISALQYHSEFEKAKGTYSQIPDSVEMKSHERNTKNYSLIKYHEDFEKNKGTKISVADDPETMRVRKNMEHVSNAVYHNEYQKKQNMEMMRPQEYDSVMENGSSQRRVGSISDYDPMNERYGSITGQYTSGGQPQQYHQPPPQQYNPPPQQYNPQPQQYNPQPQSYQQPRAPGRPESSGPMYRAMYDYNAADSDEVSFMEGDIIINTQIIDDGWMEGTVRRTGLSGMLPSNYVERA